MFFFFSYSRHVQAFGRGKSFLILVCVCRKRRLSSSQWICLVVVFFFLLLALCTYSQVVVATSSLCLHFSKCFFLAPFFYFQNRILNKSNFLYKRRFRLGRVREEEEENNEFTTSSSDAIIEERLTLIVV